MKKIIESLEKKGKHSEENNLKNKGTDNCEKDSSSSDSSCCCCSSDADKSKIKKENELKK
jgi:hypothetical protein